MHKIVYIIANAAVAIGDFFLDFSLKAEDKAVDMETIHVYKQIEAIDKKTEASRERYEAAQERYEIEIVENYKAHEVLMNRAIDLNDKYRG